MLTNYFKIAWRNLLKNKGFSAINIFGLAIGIACCLLITLYVVDEMSFDRFHEKADRIYRLNTEVKYGGAEQSLAQTPDILTTTLKKDYPQVENFVRFYDAGAFLVKKEGTINNIRESNVLYADSTLFAVFSFPLLQGNPQFALTEPNTMVLSESAAKRHFENQNPIGQSLMLDNKQAFKITGVMKDIPDNAHLKTDFFISMTSLNYGWNDFLATNFYSYILVKKEVDPKAFDTYFKQIGQKYVGPQIAKALGSSMEELEKSGSYYRFTMMPMLDVHLKSKQTKELRAGGDIQYVYIFSIIALFVLLIACINFMNLSTARSTQRAKEVGVRKVMGSLRIQLMTQFFAECVLLALLAMLLAIAFVVLLLPFFNSISGKDLQVNNLFNPAFLAFIAALPFLVGLLAGSYPAFFLSSFEPIKVLKGRLSQKGGGAGLRNGLVVFQFASSIILIVGTVVIYNQINFIQQKNVGFNKNQVLIINDAYALDKQARFFTDEVMKLKGVENGTLSGYLPTPSNRNDGAMFPAGEIDQAKAVAIARWDVDYNYIPTLGMQMVAGRNFSKDFGTDSVGVIINESAAKLFGYTDPINQTIQSLVDNQSNKTFQYKIIGVVKDFHFESLHSNIGALCLLLNTSRGNVSFRLAANTDIASIIKNIEAKWKAVAPGEPFTYTFMDESFNNVYKAEQRIGKVSLAFAVLTILVACLGLFGLVTFIAEQRIKEIGIRKVLGASVLGIVQLLSTNFVKLVLISLVIAIPVSYYVMEKWLQDFAYRIHISWWVFALASLFAMLIALVTVSFQAIKAAIANPIKSLRTE
jgi:putative ABC transport system permease protein